MAMCLRLLIYNDASTARHVIIQCLRAGHYSKRTVTKHRKQTAVPSNCELDGVFVVKCDGSITELSLVKNGKEAYSSLCYKHHTTTGTRVPYMITHCYLPPGRGDITAFTPAN